MIQEWVVVASTGADVHREGNTHESLRIVAAVTMTPAKLAHLC